MLLRLPAIIIALTFHEFCHGYAAYFLGDRTAKRDGRLSLNPVRHIDPIGMLMLIIAGFGWAKPVMVNPYNLRNPKQDMAIIAIAGPLSNFLMAFITILIAYPLVMLVGDGGWDVHRNFDYFRGIAEASGLLGLGFRFLGVLFFINIGLGIFNLLPIPPLDGSKLLAIFLPDHMYFRFISFRYGFFLLIILLVTGTIDFILGNLLGNIANGLWTLAGWIFFFL